MKKHELRFKQLYKDNVAWQELDFLRSVRNHPDIVKNVFHSKKITAIEQEKWYDEIYVKDNNWKIWITYDIFSNQPVAYVSFHIDSIMHRRCQFDYFISPDFALYKLDDKIIKWSIFNTNEIDEFFHRLWCYVFPENKFKIEKLNKGGFEIDGIVRDFVYKNNEYRNVYIMSKLLS